MLGSGEGSINSEERRRSPPVKTLKDFPSSGTGEVDPSFHSEFRTAAVDSCNRDWTSFNEPRREGELEGARSLITSRDPRPKFSSPACGKRDPKGDPLSVPFCTGDWDDRMSLNMPCSEVSTEMLLGACFPNVPPFVVIF